MASLALGQGPFPAGSSGCRQPEAALLLPAVGRRVQLHHHHHLHQSHPDSAFSSDFLFHKARKSSHAGFRSPQEDQQ